MTNRDEYNKKLADEVIRQADNAKPEHRHEVLKERIISELKAARQEGWDNRRRFDRDRGTDWTVMCNLVGKYTAMRASKRGGVLPGDEEIDGVIGTAMKVMTKCEDAVEKAYLRRGY